MAVLTSPREIYRSAVSIHKRSRRRGDARYRSAPFNYSGQLNYSFRHVDYLHSIIDIHGGAVVARYGGGGAGPDGGGGGREA